MSPRTGLHPGDTATGPIFLHAQGNLLAFLGSHGLAPLPGAADHGLPDLRVVLKRHQSGYGAHQAFLFGVQLLNGVEEIHGRSYHKRSRQSGMQAPGTDQAVRSAPIPARSNSGLVWIRF